jgi:Pentapeptide repeats (8 copies)
MIDELVADCVNCVGLCCVALAFERSDDFAFSKSAGTECRNLDTDYRCRIHPLLRAEGMKGCTVFDCHGAGQKVSQTIFGGASWRDSPGTADAMFAVFRIVRQLHEMLWYLRAAARAASNTRAAIDSMYETVDSLSQLPGDGILALDLDSVRQLVNPLLSMVSESVRSTAVAHRTTPLPSKVHAGADLLGSDLARRDLRGADLRGALLIAADLSNADLRGCDLLAADLRDANISGADLSTSLFVTQMQLNAARGNEQTRIPGDTVRPSHWT